MRSTVQIRTTPISRSLEAKSKIEDAGYTNVGELKKDDNGIWRGKASKGGSSTNVSVDFQGNVNPAK